LRLHSIISPQSDFSIKLIVFQLSQLKAPSQDI
jgi:hypothetical protein